MSEWNKKQGVIADEPTYDSTNQPRNNNPHRGHSTVYRNSYRNNDNTDYRQEAGNYKRGQHSKPTRNQKSGDWHVSQYGDTDNYKGSRERNSNNKIISHANNQSQLNNENNSSSKRNDWFTQKTDQWKNSNKGYNVRQGQNSTKQTREVSLNPNAGEFTPGFSNEADRSPSTINKIEEHVATTSKPDRYGRTEECVSDTSFLDETTASLNSTSLESSNDDAWNNVIPSSTSGKLQGSKYKNKTTKDVTPLQKDVFKNDNMSLKTSSYEAFEKKYNFLKSNTEYSVVEEIQEDLFALDDSYALGNCVAADLNMGSGIAVGFRQKFKKVDELLAQRQTSGGLAFLIHDDGRYVYYLITKKDSNKKPTYETLYRSLEKLRDNMVENNVKKLGIPRLGCGLDRLEWDKVKPMLEYIFTGTDIKVTVCNFQKADESMFKSKDDLQHRKCPLYRVNEPITKVDPWSIVLYLGTANGHIDKNIQELDTRFRISRDYKNSPRTLGSIIMTNVENYKYLIIGCIVKEKYGDHLNFQQFEQCLKAIKKKNNEFRKSQEQYDKIAIQTYYDLDDDQLMTKLENLMKNTCFKVTITVHRGA